MDTDEKAKMIAEWVSKQVAKGKGTQTSYNIPSKVVKHAQYLRGVYRVTWGKGLDQMDILDTFKFTSFPVF